MITSTVMKLYGAEVYLVLHYQNWQRNTRKNPDHPDSLGIAVSGGLEFTLTREKTLYIVLEVF
ncbi:MAG: hypothetical protein J7J30_02660 [Candidatus Odinarchaeota archaeon]|nr:hypothetical protein [Candidatus Odinarchaeota archaeon]